MAELVADDPLQLVAGKFLQGSAGDRDHRVVRGEARRERVDRVLVVENVDGGHVDPRGDRHLLDHVEEPVLQGVRGLRVDDPGPHAFGHGRAALAELSPLVKGCDRDDGQGSRADGQEQVGLPPCDGRVVQRVGPVGVASLVPEGPCHPHRARVAEGYRSRHSESEERQEPSGSLLGPFLRREEIHQLKETLGAERSAGSSMWKSSAGRNPNIPAKMTFGKVSRSVL